MNKTVLLLSLFVPAWLGAADATSEVKAEGPHHRTFSRIVSRPGPGGRVVRQTESYTQLTTGLNVRDARGRLVPSRPEFELLPDGAQSAGTAHRLRLPARLGAAFAVEITTPDGLVARCHPLAIAARAPAGQQRVWLATLTNAQGWLVASNEIVYSNCFAGLVRASLRFHNDRAGIASDLLLEELPDLQELGLPQDARLELWTEWEEATPLTELPASPRAAEALARRAPADLADRTLALGSMRMVQGKAFAGGVRAHGLAPVPGGEPVAKSLLHVGGRKFHVETLENGKLRRLFEAAPSKAAGQAAAARPQVNRLAGLPSTLPAQPARTLGPGRDRIQLSAGLNRDRKSETGRQDRATEGTATLATLDWELLNAESTDLTLGPGTWLVSGLAILWGDTVLSGGAIIKHDGNDPSTYLLVMNNLICDTSEYLPAFFTSRNDDSLGTPLSVVNTPTNYHVGLGVVGEPTLQHVRFAYADYAIHTAWGLNISHAQFLHCAHAFLPEYGVCQVRNALFVDTGSVFHGVTYQGLGSHLTVDGCLELATYFYGGPGGNTVALTNCLMVGVASLGTESVTADHTAWENTAQGVFATVGGGAHYLPSGSTNRGAGTTALDANLLEALRQRTTQAPLWLTGSQSTDLVLEPRIVPNAGAPDLGYHAARLDYVAENWTLAPGVTVILTNGAALGLSFGTDAFWGFGVILNDARFVSEGTALRPNYLARTDAVLETSAVTPASWAFFSDGYGRLSDPPPGEARFRFTVSTQFSEGGWFMVGGVGCRAWEWSHCTLWGLRVAPEVLDSPLAFGMTNCLAEHARMEVVSYSESMPLRLQNNLFRNSSLSLCPGANDAFVCDNLFDRATVTLGPGDTTVARGNAVYASSMPPSWTNLVLGDLVYQSGPLGTNYLGGNPALLYAGTYYASNIGLYHFTSLTNQTKAGTNLVSIGLHYVALDVNGLPVDGDSDGLEDHREDINGNGIADLGEFSYLAADTDGDGMSDWLEFLQGRGPQGGSRPDTNGVVRLEVFTPLR